MSTQVLRITPEHRGEDSWNVLQESTLSLLSIPLSVGLIRDTRAVGAGYQPWRRRGDKSSLTVASVVAAQVAREDLCLSPPCPQACLLLSVGECRPGCCMVRAAGLQEVTRASGAGQGTAMAASDKRGHGKSDGLQELDAVVT